MRFRRDDDIDFVSESGGQAIRNARAIIGAVCQKPIYRCVDTSEKAWQRGLVANVLGRQFGCENVSAVRIEGKMQLSADRSRHRLASNRPSGRCWQPA